MKIKLWFLSVTVFLVCSSELIFGQTADGKCGPSGNNQNCGTQFCCSQYGFCGTSAEYCGAGCQASFGKCGTGTSTSTSSTSTSSTSTSSTSTATPTTTPGAPAVDITTCTVPGSAAVTFDDGPSDFTPTLLDKLKQSKQKATFFINGNNYGCIYDYADTIIRAFNEGHQIASHTWGHQDLATLTKDQIKYQMKKLDDALVKILGVRPKYMRPPFGSGVDKSLVMTTLGELGYQVVTWDTDTNDWQGRTTTQCLDVYRKASAPPKSHIVLNHDTIKNTATNVGSQGIQILKDRGFKTLTVGECLGVSGSNNWYVQVGAPQKRDSTWTCSPSDVTGP